MNDTCAQYYPEHDRTSCSDDSIVNAEAGGSHGCARCTALLLDQRDELLVALRKSVASLEWAAAVIGDIPPNSEYMQQLWEARNLIAKTEGKA